MQITPIRDPLGLEPRQDGIKLRLTNPEAVMPHRVLTLRLIKIKGKARANIHRRPRPKTSRRPGHTENACQQLRSRNSILYRNEHVVDFNGHAERSGLC